ncbi:MAG: tetratricopeptide repeat protein [Candidatus Muiribacteriota bacterium]
MTKVKKKYKLNFKNFILFILVLSSFFYITYTFLNFKNRLELKNQEEINLFGKLKENVSNAHLSEVYEKADYFLKEFPSSPYSGYAYFIKGKFYYESQNYKEAAHNFQASRDFYLEKELRIIKYLHLSYTYMCMGDIISSYEYAQLVYETLESGKLKALAAFQLGACYSAFNILDRAVYYYDKVFEYSDDDTLEKQTLNEKLKIYKETDKVKASRLEKLLSKKYQDDREDNEKKDSI